MPTPGPAGIFCRRRADQHQRHVEHLLDGADADHAHLLQDRVEHAVLADERAGMGLRGPRARAGRPGLDQHDRLLAPPRLLQRAHELRAVRDAFEIGGDDPRAVVLREGVQVVREADDGLVAAADQARKPKPAASAIAKALVPMPPLWLTIEIAPRRSESISCSAVAKVAVTGNGGVDDADAVRAAEREAGVAAERDERALQLDALAAGLREPARIGDAVAHAAAAQSRIASRRPEAGIAENDQVRDARQLGDAREGRLARDRLG